METKSNEPAFASIHTPWLKGLTKREYFAAMALQGMLAKYGSDYQVQNAKEAIYWADALIEELNKTKTNEK